MEEGDEIQVLVGSYLRDAVIEKVAKAAADEHVETTSRPRPNEGTTTNYDQQSLSIGGDGKQTEPKFFDPSGQAPTTPGRRLSADRFYEPGYLRVIREFGIEKIDTEGPITFRHLSTILARAHGFQRTGSQIKKQVWAAVSKARRSTKALNDETIFWPDGSEPTTIISFRGVTGGDEGRSWQDVPYPEKLGLAHSFLSRSPYSDVAAAMASKIGFGRLTQKTREEFEALLKAVREIESE